MGPLPHQQDVGGAFLECGCGGENYLHTHLNVHGGAAQAKVVLQLKELQKHRKKGHGLIISWCLLRLKPFEISLRDIYNMILSTQNKFRNACYYPFKCILQDRNQLFVFLSFRGNAQ